MTVTDTGLPSFDYEAGVSPYPLKVDSGNECLDEEGEIRPLIKF